MRILLVRHGQSLANIDSAVYKTTADHDIGLTDNGIEQAMSVGNFLKSYFENDYKELLDNTKSDTEKAKLSLNNMMKNSGFGGEFGDVVGSLFSKVAKNFPANDVSFSMAPKIKLYSSPYRRARQTSNYIKEAMGSLLTESEEDVLLGEQNFGIMNGLEDDEFLTFFPKEAECYNQVKNSTGGRLFARAGQAESGLDVIIRLRLFLQQLKEDFEEEGINDFIIVCHGNIVKLFTMAFCKHTPEWYDSERTPGNCSVRLLNNKTDGGYIFDGWKHDKKR